jgi:two-component system, sensor histidine kinase and response regulator
MTLFPSLLPKTIEFKQRLISRLLQKRGHPVKIASHGGEAVQALASPAFDLILMGVQRPGVDGLTAIRMIREQELSSGEHIPIVALSAQAMKGRPDGYLTKPIIQQALAKLLAKILASRPATLTP